MLRAAPKICDLFFSPSKPPMIEVNGRLSPVGARVLTPDDTLRIAKELVGNNKHAADNLREQGSCDVSYGLAGASRFRVNIFTQRSSFAIVMRVIPSKVPNFTELNLPDELQQGSRPAKWHCTGNWPYRFRQVLYAGRNHGFDQQETLIPNSDHRRPD